MSRIWHNPACSTSRKALAALQAAGETPEVILYLKQGWTEPQLRALFAAAGLTPRQALRVKGTRAADLGLTDPDTSDAAILAAMLAEPALVERPFVATARGTRLCRPFERLAEILP
ncbi:arsenate reductase (glutaredoxin) [Xinfangfangia pollutisoli]|uniref:arsenate reductase (glutaredoxin) n=1 Tax=Xinfangfangia pollutisoli TaxID=2865960 RepID=UPI001CD5BCCA|nr:arsenate reductase (glutaredoxin) [Xinfangfangia pollutisoli]